MEEHIEYRAGDMDSQCARTMNVTPEEIFRGFPKLQTLQHHDIDFKYVPIPVQLKMAKLLAGGDMQGNLGRGGFVSIATELKLKTTDINLIQTLTSNGGNPSMNFFQYLGQTTTDPYIERGLWAFCKALVKIKLIDVLQELENGWEEIEREGECRPRPVESSVPQPNGNIHSSRTCEHSYPIQSPCQSLGSGNCSCGIMGCPAMSVCSQQHRSLYSHPSLQTCNTHQSMCCCGGHKPLHNGCNTISMSETNHCNHVEQNRTDFAIAPERLRSNQLPATSHDMTAPNRQLALTGKHLGRNTENQLRMNGVADIKHVKPEHQLHQLQPGVIKPELTVKTEVETSFSCSEQKKMEGCPPLKIAKREATEDKKPLQGYSDAHRTGSIEFPYMLNKYLQGQDSVDSVDMCPSDQFNTPTSVYVGVPYGNLEQGRDEFSMDMEHGSSSMDTGHSSHNAIAAGPANCLAPSKGFHQPQRAEQSLTVTDQSSLQGAAASRLNYMGNPCNPYPTYPPYRSTGTSDSAQSKNSEDSLRRNKSSKGMVESSPFKQVSSSISHLGVRLFMTHYYHKHTPVSIYPDCRRWADVCNRQVLELADCLRKNNFSVQIDVTRAENQPSRGTISWHEWINQRLNDARFILVCITPLYLKIISPGAYQDPEDPTEINNNLLTTRYIYHLMEDEYERQGRNTRFIPVLFWDIDRANLPTFLQHVHLYRWNKDFLDLFWHLSMPEQQLLRFVNKA